MVLQRAFWAGKRKGKGEKAVEMFIIRYVDISLKTAIDLLLRRTLVRSALS